MNVNMSIQVGSEQNLRRKEQEGNDHSINRIINTDTRDLYWAVEEFSYLFVRKG